MVYALEVSVSIEQRGRQRDREQAETPTIQTIRRWRLMRMADRAAMREALTIRQCDAGEGGDVCPIIDGTRGGLSEKFHRRC
jgi:hypothetical protein